MFLLLNGTSNTFSVHLTSTISTCTLNVRSVADGEAEQFELTPNLQNERYAEFTWEVPATMEGQYLIDFMDGQTRLCTHVAYIAETEDAINYQDYTFYDSQA